MKMFSRLKYTLAAMAMLLGAQHDARAAFTLDGGFEGDEAVKNGFCFIDFFDVGTEAFWIFNGRTPIYTVALAESGGWDLEEKVMRKDGSFVVLYQNPVAPAGGNVQFALWIFGPNGALTTAVTFSTSGWDPRLESDGQLLGNNKTLIFFDNFPVVNQLAAWLLGPSGAIEKTFLWADVGGWVVEDSACDEFGNLFRILYDNPTARQLTQFVFDGDGNWTGANTFTY